MNCKWQHGDVSDAELRDHGLDPARCVDFAVNVDPAGPHPRVLAAFREAAVGRYPDPQARRLREALAQRETVSPASILVGVGATGLLFAMMHTLRPGARAVVLEPGFAEYEMAIRAAHLLPIPAPWAHTSSGHFDAAGADALLHRTHADMIVLGCPNNPTGQTLDYSELRWLALRHLDRVIVLDEAFLRLSEEHEQATVALPANVWRLRSLTKELGIPGLRVGYLLAEPRHLHVIAQQQAPWSVGAAALAAAEAGVLDGRIVDDARARMRADIESLRAELAMVGFETSPTRTVFCLVRVRDAAMSRARLLERGILVRDCTSFGLPTHLRVSARPASDRKRLIDGMLALREAGA